MTKTFFRTCNIAAKKVRYAVADAILRHAQPSVTLGQRQSVWFNTPEH